MGICTSKNACQPIKLDSINRNEDDIQFSNDKIHQQDIFLSQPIFLDGELIGAISILFDTRNIQNRIYKYIAIVTIIFLITVGVAFLLSSRLQHVISSPISQLGKTAKYISKHKDYSIRAVKHNDDELGLLVDTFNNMLETIEQQNVAVVATKERYRIMYDYNPAMLFIIDIDGKVLSITQFGAEQSGYTVDEFIGQCGQIQSRAVVYSSRSFDLSARWPVCTSEHLGRRPWNLAPRHRPSVRQILPGGQLVNEINHRGGQPRRALAASRSASARRLIRRRLKRSRRAWHVRG